MTNIAIFASGSGSNAENIARYFAFSDLARVKLILTDNPEAAVLGRADKMDIPHAAITRPQLRECIPTMKLLSEHKIDYIVLAGFLSLIPSGLIQAYKDRIINIHPALLPAYGGKGMYGDNVHRAVIANGDKESGITIHAVNERYDEGTVIAQYKVGVTPFDTPETLACKIHELEYEHFPKVIESEIRKLTNLNG